MEDKFSDVLLEVVRDHVPRDVAAEIVDLVLDQLSLESRGRKMNTSDFRLATKPEGWLYQGILNALHPTPVLEVNPARPAEKQIRTVMGISPPALRAQFTGKCHGMEEDALHAWAEAKDEIDKMAENILPIESGFIQRSDGVWIWATEVTGAMVMQMLTQARYLADARASYPCDIDWEPVVKAIDGAMAAAVKLT